MNTYIALATCILPEGMLDWFNLKYGGTSKNLCLGIDVSEPKKEELDIYYSM